MTPCRMPGSGTTRSRTSIPTYYNPSELPIWTAAGTIDPSSPGVATFNSKWAAPLPFYLNGIREAGVEGTPRGEVENKYNTWQPRIGFSEDMFGNGKTVLRGGFGTFFERTQGNDVYNAAPNAPFVYGLNTGSPYLSSPGVNWSTGVNAAAAGLPDHCDRSGRPCREQLQPAGGGHVLARRAA